MPRDEREPVPGPRAPAAGRGRAEAARLLDLAFGQRGRLTELGSHQDRNYLVETADGERFVLKVARRGTGRAELEAENAAILHAAGGRAALRAADPAAGAGRGADRVRDDHGRRRTRPAPGRLDRRRADGPGRTPRAGRPARPRQMAARIALALRGLRSPGAGPGARSGTSGTPGRSSRRSCTDSRRRPSGAPWPSRRRPARRRPSSRLRTDLRVRVIHADVTDLNTVARRDRAGRPMPAGLIDFGDLSRTWLAADLAVTIAADVFHDLDRPLQAAREVARGFLARLPLTEAELAAIWPMVLARSAAVAVSGDQQAALEPDNAYVAATRDEEWAALEAVAGIPFELATEMMREVAGLGPARRLTLPVTAVSPVGVPARLMQALDLSTGSADLPGAATGDPSVIDALADAIRRGGGIPIGRWGEARLTDAELDATIEAATVHLGVDLFLPSGTPVVAPVDGVVRQTPAGLTIDAAGFAVRLDGVAPAVQTGAAVEAGAPVGRVAGDGPDGLPALVHVQLVTVPGLEAPRRAVPSLADAWLRLCPDPSSLIGLAPRLAAAPPDDAAGLLVRRDRVLAGVQVHYFDAPPRIERGWRHHLVDTRRPRLRRPRQQRRRARSQPPRGRGRGDQAASAAQHQLPVPVRRHGRVRGGARRPLPGAARHRVPGQHRQRGQRAGPAARPDRDRQRGRPGRPGRVPRLDGRDRRDHDVPPRQPAGARDAPGMGPPGRGAQHLPRPAPGSGRRHPVRGRRPGDRRRAGPNGIADPPRSSPSHCSATPGA